MDKTIVKGLRTLECLISCAEPQGIAALSEALQMGKSNVHRILATLTHTGYVHPVGGGRYEATLKMWEHGVQVLVRKDIRAARPHLIALVSATGETAHLSVLDGTEVVYVDKLDGEHPVRASPRIGARAPAHAVATGKVLLAFQPLEAIREYYSLLKRFTPKTITTAAALDRALDEVRREGVGTNVEGWQKGVCGIAAPIRNSAGDVIAAIGISGPPDRLTAKARRAFSAVVIDAANSASRSLGFLGGRFDET